MTPANYGPETEARRKIDAALVEAGWTTQHREGMRVAADLVATERGV